MKTDFVLPSVDLNNPCHSVKCVFGLRIFMVYELYYNCYKCDSNHTIKNFTGSHLQGPKNAYELLNVI